MIRDLIIYSQPRFSTTAREIQHALNCRRLSGRSVAKIGRIPLGCLCVNWGETRYPAWLRDPRQLRWLNSPDQIAAKGGKINQIAKFREAGIPTVEITTSIEVAQRWRDSGATVLSRRDNARGGQGISIVSHGGGGGVPVGDFYSKYYPKTHEYRVHVFLSGMRGGVVGGRMPLGGEGAELYEGGIIDITQKKRSNDTGDGPPGRGDVGGFVENRTVYQRIVRSHANGWVHAHENLHLPGEATDGINIPRESIIQAAVGAVRTLGLDFGAVDVAARYSKRDPDKLLSLAVLEVNAAPGIQNKETLDKYVNAIRGCYNGN